MRWAVQVALTIAVPLSLIWPRKSLSLSLSREISPYQSLPLEWHCSPTAPRSPTPNTGARITLSALLFGSTTLASGRCAITKALRPPRHGEHFRSSRDSLREPLRPRTRRRGGVPPPLPQQPGRGSNQGTRGQMPFKRGTSAA